MLEMLKGYFSQMGLTFWVLWITMFTVMFAEYLSNPPVPFLLEEFLVHEVAVVTMIGYLNSIYNLANTTITIPGAILADKLERSTIILVSLCLLPLSYLLLLFATESWGFLIAYLIYGIFEGISLPSFLSLITDFAPQSRRAIFFAIFSLSWFLSETLAPTVGGLLSDEFFLRFPLIIAFLISIMGLLIYLGYLKGLKSQRPTSQTQSVKPNGNTASYTASFKRTLSLLCVIQFFSGLGWGISYPITVAFLMYALGATPTELGIVFSIGFGVAAILAQIPGGKVADKFGSKPVIAVCILVSAPLFLMLPLSTNVFHFALILGIIGFAMTLSSPAWFAWVANQIETGNLGKGYGFTSAAFGAGAILGPIIGSFIWTLLEPNYFLSFAVVPIPFLLVLPFIIAIRNVATVSTKGIRPTETLATVK